MKLRDLDKTRAFKILQDDNCSIYNPDNVKELTDNVLYLLEQIKERDFEPSESLDYLKNIFKNYYGDVVLDFITR